MTYLLDTNIVSFALKNNFQIKARLEQLKSQRELVCISYYLF